MILPTWRACPRQTLGKHVEASPRCTSIWRCWMVRHTSLLYRSVPPFLPSKCRVDPIQISSYTVWWKKDQTAVWQLLWSCIRVTFYNMCSQRSPPMSMPTSSLGTPNGHRFHPRCKWTCRFPLDDPWVAVELLLHVPSVCETTCRTSCNLCLLWPVGPMRSPNSAGRFLLAR